jgi:archaellum component FlaC
MTTVQELDRRVALIETRQREQANADEAAHNDLRTRLEKIGRNTAAKFDLMLVNDRVESLAAVSQDTREAVHRLEKKAAEHDERFDAVDARFDGMDARFDGVDRRFDGMDARFDGMERRFDGTDARFDGMDRRMDDFDVKVDVLAQRFDGFDAKIGGIDAKVGGFDARMTELQTGVGRLLELMEEARG